MFGRDWQQAEATIVMAATVPIHKHDRRQHYECVVEVHPPGEESFRAKLAQPETDSHFAFPNQGQTVGVKFDRKSRKVKWDHNDPRSFNKVNAEQAGLDAALQAPAGSPPASSS